MFGLIKSMFIMLAIMGFCLIPSVISVLLIDWRLEISDTWKGGICISVWMFSMLWVGGFCLSAMAQGWGSE